MVIRFASNGVSEGFNSLTSTNGKTTYGHVPYDWCDYKVLRIDRLSYKHKLILKHFFPIKRNSLLIAQACKETLAVAPPPVVPEPIGTSAKPVTRQRNVMLGQN